MDKRIGEIVEVRLDGRSFPAILVRVFEYTYGVQCLFYDSYYLIPHSCVSFEEVAKHYVIPQD